ncbi:DUF1761 domain-containing protein [Pseudochryseolinea flava]|uniref:DUF1761 domain-containing protein n=1 Tax=Pseudochryseolinea flava TaxID=2059302 RepID=A0A364Y7J0_9BACT|nr:DUF1761 domain-containing protein [Pseudochryseolinea flava]RAW02104.1 DUF1761 domain-containing protein [Pseudochryseolinea flava]
MINLLSNLNWWGVLAAFLPYTILGALWFTLFFVKPYKATLGKANQELNNKAPIYIVGPMICTFFITVAAAIFIDALNIQTMGNAIEFAFIAGIGFLVANTLNIAINPNIPHPIRYGVITGSYHLVGITIASIIIVLMK